MLSEQGIHSVDGSRSKRQRLAPCARRPPLRTSETIANGTGDSKRAFHFQLCQDNANMLNVGPLMLAVALLMWAVSLIRRWQLEQWLGRGLRWPFSWKTARVVEVSLTVSLIAGVWETELLFWLVFGVGSVFWAGTVSQRSVELFVAGLLLFVTSVPVTAFGSFAQPPDLSLLMVVLQHMWIFIGGYLGILLMENRAQFGRFYLSVLCAMTVLLMLPMFWGGALMKLGWLLVVSSSFVLDDPVPKVSELKRGQWEVPHDHSLMGGFYSRKRHRPDVSPWFTIATWIAGLVLMWKLTVRG